MVPLRPGLTPLKPYIPGRLEPGKIKMASNENPLGPSPLAMEAVKHHLASVQLYPNGAAPELVQALARHYQIDTANIIPGNGSDEILQLAAGSFIQSGEEVLIADHTFSVYEIVSVLFGASIVTVPLNKGYNDLDAFAAALTPKTRIVFLCSPNNPTGTIIGNKPLEKFMAQVSPQTLVILDQAYAEFVEDPDYPDARTVIGRYPNILVTRTFSKIYGLAGLRIGYGVGNPDLIQNLQRIRPPFNVGNLGQAAGAAALVDHDFFKKSIDLNQQGRVQLSEGFTQLGLRFLPSQANFVCVETNRDSRAMYDAIAAGGVTIRGLASFGLPGCLRISTGTEAQNALVLKALEHALAVVPPIAGYSPYL